MVHLLPQFALGRTSLQISQLGFGTAPVGNLYKNVPEERAVEAIRHAFSKGVNFFDTAPLYGAGLAEERLGLALADQPRNSYVIATKVGHLVDPADGIVADYSRDGIVRSLEASLKRLKVDRADIVHIHEPASDAGISQAEFYHNSLRVVLPTLQKLREQGLLQAIGVGLNDWPGLVDFAQAADFDCFLLAGRYTLLEQTAGKQLFPICQAKNISLLLGGVYNSGILASGARSGAKYNYTDAPPEILEKVTRLELVCQRYNLPLSAVALRFALSPQAVSGVVIGMETVDEIEANLTALQTSVPTDLWKELLHEGLLDETALQTANLL